MSPFRFALLLLILGGLVLFVLQNWTPVLPLVILGTPSQPLPLAFWMMTAIAAGALTTIVIAGLFRITAFTAAPRKRSNRRPWNMPPSPVNGRPGWDVPPTDAADVPFRATDPTATRIQSDDDWEGTARAAWDDWEAPEPAAPTDVRRVESPRRSEDYRPDAPPQPFDRTHADEEIFDRLEPEEPPIYDAPYEVYRPPYSERFDRTASEPEYPPPDYWQSPYPEPPDSEPESAEPEPEVWDDWEEEADENREDDRPIAPPEPQRPIVEVQQEPKTRYRSGTVYSYSYRDDEPSSSPVDSSSNISRDDASAQNDRVIIPPSPHPDAVTDAADEDWGFEDDEDDPDETDSRSRRDRAHRDDDW